MIFPPNTATAPAATLRGALAAAALLVAPAVPAMEGMTEDGSDAPAAEASSAGAHGVAAGAERTVPTDAGRFLVTVAARPAPLEINVMHAWEVRVATPDGAPVAGAGLAIGGGMPAHSHGLPTAPRVTAEPAPGAYLVEGFRFQMPGVWVVTFDVAADGASDSATFEFEL